MTYFDELRLIVEEMGRRNLVTEARVHDRNQMAALKEHALVSKLQPPEGVGLFGVTIYEDTEIPKGIIRFYRTDGTTNDLWLR